jgi:hypothetical protein
MLKAAIEFINSNPRIQKALTSELGKTITKCGFIFILQSFISLSLAGVIGFLYQENKAKDDRHDLNIKQVEIQYNINIQKLEQEITREHEREIKIYENFIERSRQDLERLTPK